MKFPKTVMRLCPYCRKHTEHKVSMAKKRTRASAHPMSWGSKLRAQLRGRGRGYGNLGRYSKPSKPKMTGKKQSKKTDLRYECGNCGLMHVQRAGFRVKRIEFA